VNYDGKVDISCSNVEPPSLPTPVLQAAAAKGQQSRQRFFTAVPSVAETKKRLHEPAALSKKPA